MRGGGAPRRRRRARGAGGARARARAGSAAAPARAAPAASNSTKMRRAKRATARFAAPGRALVSTSARGRRSSSAASVKPAPRRSRPPRSRRRARSAAARAAASTVLAASGQQRPRARQEPPAHDGLRVERDELEAGLGHEARLDAAPRAEEEAGLARGARGLAEGEGGRHVAAVPPPAIAQRRRAAVSAGPRHGTTPRGEALPIGAAPERASRRPMPSSTPRARHEASTDERP